MKTSLTCAAACCLLTAVAGAEPIVLDKYTVRDAAAVNQDAVTFLKPKGWKVDGGIKWYPNLAHQACLEVRVTNPDGPEQIEWLPWTGCTWFINPIVPMARGSNYIGNIVLEPIEDPKEYVRKIALPMSRGRANARITDYQEMPEVAKEISQANNGVKVRSGRVRVEYELNGKAVEEDFYVSLFMFQFQLGINSTSILWGPAREPFALRAAKGELDAKTPLLLSTANSATINPHWFGEYRYVCDLFIQRMNNAIQNARNLSDYIRRNNDEITRMSAEAYRNRQESLDRCARQFSNYIRGVESYTSPFERYPVQLPNNYKYAWASPNGGYILSNEAGFNPNVGSTRNWQLLKKAN